jgi:hypothetical protein
MLHRPRAGVSPSTIARAEAPLATADAAITTLKTVQVMKETAKAAAEKAAAVQTAEARADHYASLAKGTADTGLSRYYAQRAIEARQKASSIRDNPEASLDAREAKAKAFEDQASLWLKQADSNEFNAGLRAYYRDKAFEARREAARLRGEDAPE